MSHVGQSLCDTGKWHFGAVGGVLLPSRVPLAECALLIGINEPHGDIADAFSFDCEVSGKGRLPLPPFWDVITIVFMKTTVHE